jgi:hypothetical protein
MEPTYQIVVGRLGIVFEGEDLNRAAAVFYERMLKEQASPQSQPVVLLENGSVATVYAGKDYSRC